MSSNHQTFNYIHCDVFASAPYSGNSLAVFTESAGLTSEQMLTITQELRHFESIFLHETDGRIVGSNLRSTQGVAVRRASRYRSGMHIAQTIWFGCENAIGHLSCKGGACCK